MGKKFQLKLTILNNSYITNTYHQKINEDD